MAQFHKLGNCSVRDNAFFTLKGQIWKTMDHRSVDGMLMLPSPKQYCRSLQNSNMLLGVFWALSTNPPCVPKRILKASFISP